ncbi:hypothetical protein [Embleya sp. NPDC059259]|uniref:hypothetical protein n=1 Tax=unclassified Embleya TaxID=2699296 RepID=UPI0036B9A06B
MVRRWYICSRVDRHARRRYDRRHHTLRTALDGIPGLANPDFTAHALLAATRADLVEYLVTRRHTTREQLRADLTSHCARVLDSPTPQP